MTEESLFAAALQKPAGAERQAFLEATCSGDAALRERVERLLAADEQSTGILERPDVAAAEPALIPGRVFASRFKLRQKLDSGGMGEVWVADQIEPVQRRVAIKVVRPGMDSEPMLARFEHERQALALMDHPNIAKVLDAGAADGRPYFVMELIKGVPITRYCDEAKLSPRERLELFIPVCHAVQHAHQKGIIHRDLKPSNIVVGMYDGKPVPKVIDFGVAKAIGPRLTEKTVYTEVGTLIGTLEYMSPEQAELNNLDIDTRSDIYTLGAILYELLTGCVPFSRQEFQAGAFAEMLRMIREVDPPKPSTKLSGSGTLPSVAAVRHTEPKKLVALIRGELDWIVLKCLEKDRSRRYETANGLAEDLQRYLADEPVVAGPPSTGYRVRKFIRRNSKVLATAGVFVVLLLVSAVVSTWQASRATQAERLAKQNEREARAVNEFLLKELLGQTYVGNQPLGPDRPARNPKITVRELLDRAGKSIAGKFVSQPLVEAAVRQTLADTYFGLGEYVLAVPHAERALELRRAYLGTEHPDTLLTLSNLSHAYNSSGRPKEAIALLEQVRDARMKQLGPDHPDTLGTLHDLAVTYDFTGRPSQAIDLYAKVRDAQVRQLGPDHPDTLTTLSNMAASYARNGRATEAIPLLERVRDTRMRQLGADHPRTLTALKNLAAAYHEAGRRTTAIDLLERVREDQTKVLEADHPDTLLTMSELADAYQLAGNLPKAIRLYEHIVQVRQKKLPPGHVQTLMTLNSLASAYQAAGRVEESILAYEQLRDIYEKKSGPEHRHTLYTLKTLAGAYQAAGKPDRALPVLHQAAATIEKAGFQHPDAGRIVDSLSECLELLKQFDQAEVWRRKWLAVVKEKAGPESVGFTAELSFLGFNLVKQRRWVEAESVLRESLDIRQKREANEWTTFDTRSLLGDALLGQEKYADAESLLAEGYTGMKERQGKIPPNRRIRLTESLERLVQLYDSWGKPAEAAKWRDELATLAKP